MSDKNKDVLKINRPTSASILQELLEKFDKKFEQFEEQQQAANQQIEQLRQTVQTTIPPPWEATELGEQLKGFQEQLAQIQQSTAQAEKTQQEAITQVAQRVGRLQTALETLKPPSTENLLPDLTSKLEEVLNSKVQQAVQAGLASQQATLQELQTTVSNLKPPSLSEITKAFNSRLGTLEEESTAQSQQVKNIGERMQQVQTDVQAIQPAEIVKQVEAYISQLPIPSVAEIAAALNGRFDALDTLSKQQGELLQAQNEIQQQQTDFAETFTQLKADLLATTESQFRAFQTQVDQKISEVTAEFSKQIEPVQAAQKAIEAATQQLNTVSTNLTDTVTTLKSDLQGEINTLKEQQGEIRQTAANLSSAMGKLDGQVQQIAQSVESLEGAAKQLETFAEETLLPKLQGQLDSALAKLKSAQEAHQTKMDGTVADLGEEVQQLQQANQRFQTIETKTEEILQYLRAMTPSLPDEWVEAYKSAIGHITAFENDGDPSHLNQAEKLLAFRNEWVLRINHPLFAAAVENALARIWYDRKGGKKSEEGDAYAEKAKFILEIYHKVRIPKGKNLKEKIEINRDWIEKKPLTPPIAPST